MPIRMGLIALVAAMAVVPASAQKSTGPTITQKPSVGIPAGPKTAASSTTGTPAPVTFPREVTLLCKKLGSDAGPRVAHPNDPILMGSSQLTYENVSIRDASGTTRTVYVPISAMITVQFKPAAGAAGERGELLRDYECGLSNASLNSTSISDIRFSNPSGFSLLTSSAMRETKDGNSWASVAKPYCPSGILSFTATQSGPADFGVGMGTRINCVN